MYYLVNVEPYFLRRKKNILKIHLLIFKGYLIQQNFITPDKGLSEIFLVYSKKKKKKKKKNKKKQKKNETAKKTCLLLLEMLNVVIFISMLFLIHPVIWSL